MHPTRHKPEVLYFSPARIILPFFFKDNFTLRKVLTKIWTLMTQKYSESDTANFKKEACLYLYILLVVRYFNAFHPVSLIFCFLSYIHQSYTKCHKSRPLTRSSDF
jgi:hypothetical protein